MLFYVAKFHADILWATFKPKYLNYVRQVDPSASALVIFFFQGAEKTMGSPSRDFEIF